MHNGVLESLETVIGFYATRDTNPEIWYTNPQDGRVCKFNDVPAHYRKYVNVFIAPFDRQVGQEPRFSQAEGDAMVAFLKTLTDR